MTILSVGQSATIRKNVLDKFIDKSDDWYKEKVALQYDIIDGEKKTAAYYWEGILSPQIISVTKAYSILQEKYSFFLMWDDNLFISKELLYPRLAVLSLSYEDFLENRESFPEDIYLFDDSFSWIICLTHETGDNEEDYCIISMG